MDALDLFLESPYFTKGYQIEKHKALFRLFATTRLEADSGALEKDQVYRHLFPEGPIVKGKLEKLISEFKKLLQKFLITQRCFREENENERLLALATEMRERDLEGQYKLALDRARKAADESLQESMVNYLFRLNVVLEEFEGNNVYNKEKGDLNIPDQVFYLDRYYYAKRLALLNCLLLQQKVTVLPARAAALVAQPWTLPNAWIESSTLIHLSWEIYRILQKAVPVIEDFEQLYDLLQTNAARIAPEQLKEYFTYTRNFCTLLLDLKGQLEIRPVLFQIQMDNLKRGYFYYEGKISSHAMLNITLNALYVPAVSWANDFVEQHKDRIIGENETHDYYRLSRAFCLFAEKKYEAALDMIPFGTSHSVFHLAARRLELKIYYEQDSDLLPYKIDAFQMFIWRAGNNTLSKNLFEVYVNFINLVRQLSVSPKIKSPARSKQLIQRINARKMLAERTWLLEKAMELGK